MNIQEFTQQEAKERTRVKRLHINDEFHAFAAKHKSITLHNGTPLENLFALADLNSVIEIKKGEKKHSAETKAFSWKKWSMVIAPKQTILLKLVVSNEGSKVRYRKRAQKIGRIMLLPTLLSRYRIGAKRLELNMSFFSVPRGTLPLIPLQFNSRARREKRVSVRMILAKRRRTVKIKKPTKKMKMKKVINVYLENGPLILPEWRYS